MARPLSWSCASRLECEYEQETKNKKNFKKEEGGVSFFFFLFVLGFAMGNGSSSGITDPQNFCVYFGKAIPTGVEFNFCPWCGSKLINQRHQEIEFSDIQCSFKDKARKRKKKRKENGKKKDSDASNVKVVCFLSFSSHKLSFVAHVFFCLFLLLFLSVFAVVRI